MLAGITSEDPLSRIVINELLTHTDGISDFIELYNRGTQDCDVSGCVLSDALNGNTFVIPPSTILGPNAFISFDTNVLGFALSMAGDDIYLLDPSGYRALDAIRYPAQVNGVSSGRYPDGSDAVRVLASPTPAKTNRGLYQQDVVINEIMYHSVWGEEDAEYIELFNRTAETIDVSYWRFTDGISFTFPVGTSIGPTNYLVIARSAARLIARYPQLHTGNCIGNFRGGLSDRGERIVLSRPDDANLPNQDFVTIDTVEYCDGDDWGRWADGGGSSLELIDPHGDNRHPSNWRGSDESMKSEWLDIDYVDYVSGGDDLQKTWTYGTDFERLFVMANQAGEFLIDSISMTPAAGGTDLVPNSNLTTEMSPWLAQGNHMQTTRDAAGGYGNDDGVLHVRAAGQGNIRSMATVREPQFDRVAVQLNSPPVKNEQYRITAKVRWLAGWPFMRLSHGWYWMEALCEMPVPQNLGTPGLPNSHAVTNTPPTVSALRHSPVLPAAGEGVVVTCRLLDPDGVGTPVLEYRNTAGPTYTAVTMRDDGTVPDTVAGDSSYAATLPGQAAGTLMGFRLQIADAAAPPASAHYPSDSTSRDCLVRFGDPQPHAHLGHHTLWVSPENETLWLSWDTKGNAMVDMTWIYNGERIAYNGKIRWRGNGRVYSDIEEASYSFTIPKTQRFIGSHEVKVDYPSRGGGADADKRFRELAAYWTARQAGAAASQIRYIHVHVNGSSILRHDLEVASREMCSYWYDDGDPHTFEHKAEDPLETHIKTTTGALNMAKYRHGMQKKRTRVPDADYRRLVLIAKALDLQTDDIATARLLALIDPYGMAAYFAGNRVARGRDTYGWTNKHNGFAYGSPHRRMRWHLVDMDSAFSANWTASDTLFPIQAPGEIFNRPVFRRGYLRILKAIADRPFHPDRCTPFLEKWHQALLDEGLAATAPTVILTRMATRRTHITDELANHVAPFAITSPAVTETSSRIVDFQGTASYDIKKLAVNGKDLRVTFPSTTEWESQIELQPGPNVLSLVGFDRENRLVASNQVTVTCTAQAVTPTDKIVINEIMYNPVRDRAEFIEIHNVSATDTFDLGGWRLDGVSFTFDAGTVLTPGAYCVVAEDLQIYGHTHTNSEVVVGDYDGSLDNGGETLKLLAPLASGGWVEIDRVRYDDDAPWPAASTNGCSLQLVDSTRDNSRVGNWATLPTGVAATPGTVNSVAESRPAFPSLWINEIMPSNTASAADNMGEREPWIEILNADSNTINLGTGYFLSDSTTNLTGWAFPSSTSLAADTRLVVFADGESEESAPEEPHTSWRMNSASGTVILAREYLGDILVLDVLAYGLIDGDFSYGSYPEGDAFSRQIFHYPSPGNTNSPTSQPVLVRINEWMADNDTFIADPAGGGYEDWFELYNFGEVPVMLGGFSLTDNALSSNRFSIPGGYVLNAREHLLVWADNDPEQNGGVDLHTDFNLSRDGEEIALFAPDGRLVDLAAFSSQQPDSSEGRWPDGVSDVYLMAPPTPGASNRILRIGSPSFEDSNHAITWQAESDQVYRLESSVSLQTGTWQHVGIVTAHHAVVTLTDTNVTQERVLFYRLRKQ